MPDARVVDSQGRPLYATKYVTSDGKTFSTESKAIAHVSDQNSGMDDLWHNFNSSARVSYQVVKTPINYGASSSTPSQYTNPWTGPPPSVTSLNGVPVSSTPSQYTNPWNPTPIAPSAPTVPTPTPRPAPAAPVDTRTQAEKEAAFYAAYNTAIDKAIAGDPTEMKNLDRFFTGAERPAIAYDPGYLQLERRAQAAGVSVDQQKANETALATSSTKLIRGDGPINPDDGGANTGNGAAVFAVNAAGQKFHITGNAAQDMRNNGTWTEPVVVSQSVVDGMAFGGRIEWSSELANINPAPPPVPAVEIPLIPQPPASEPAAPAEPATPAEPANPAEGGGPASPASPAEPATSAETAQANAEEHRKDEEAHAKAAAAQAEADEKKEQALAVATANKQSAKEARLKKIMEMRKPWGGASSSTGADAMVVPPITPASQVPPPPFQ